MLLVALLIYLARLGWMDQVRYSLYDDAFISFRYASNLASGEGLVFNPGQRVQGYTNFLWTVMLAAAMRAGADPVIVARGLGTVCGALYLLITVLLTSRLTPIRGAWLAVPALLLASTASLPRYAISGMETLFFSVCIAAAIWIDQAVSKSWGGWLAAFVLGLAALTRPEGVLFFVLLTAIWVIESSWRGEDRAVVLRGALHRLVVFGAVFLPYFILSYAYYGYPLPNTFYAKAGGITTAAIGRGLRYLRDQLLILNLPLVLWGAMVLPLIRRTRVAALLTALLAYLCYLVLIGGDDWAVFGPRFLLVVFPWLAALGLAGLVELTAARRWLMLTLSGAAIVLIGVLSFFEANAYQGVMNTMNRGWWAAAEWLAARADPDEMIAVDAAGIIPYYTDLPSLDMLGLNDLHIAHLEVPRLGSGLAGHEKFDPQYVLRQQPAYIATWLDSSGKPVSAGLAQVSGPLMEEYELAVVFLMGPPKSGQPPWLSMGSRVYDEDLHQRGYIYGIFRRKAAAGDGSLRAPASRSGDFLIRSGPSQAGNGAGYNRTALQGSATTDQSNCHASHKSDKQIRSLLFF